MSLNYTVYFRHVQKLIKHYLYLKAFKVLFFLFMENLILTIKYVFSFFLVFIWFRSGLQVIHCNLDHPRFLGAVDIGGYL